MLGCVAYLNGVWKKWRRTDLGLSAIEIGKGEEDWQKSLAIWQTHRRSNT
jgi:hypothetical protein